MVSRESQWPQTNSGMLYKGLSPSGPVNLRLQSTSARVVEPVRTAPERRPQGELHYSPWDNSRYQALTIITTARASRGQVSTCNAGAAASPAEFPPSRPSMPGITHHQGRGNSPLREATIGVSMCSNLRII